MAIEVRVPTILRSYTDGQKAVQGAGDTIADLLDRPRHQVPRASAAGSSPTRARCTASSTSTSTTRTSASSARSTPSSATATP